MIPESLGSTDHVLPKGIVCDSCNRCFAVKIEQPVLSSGIFRDLRRRMAIPSKKGRLPPAVEPDASLLPTYRVMGRLIGKVGLEALAARTCHVQGWEREVMDKAELNGIRDYVRYDHGREDWPFSFRTLYPVNAVFTGDGEPHQVLHEYDLLYAERGELYVVVAIFGVEFALNMGGPELDGYITWVREHEFISPLYEGRNAGPMRLG